MKINRFQHAVLLGFLSLFMTVNANSVGLEDQLGGYTLDDLAKAFAKQGDIRADYGEANEDAPFDAYLQQEFDSDSYEYQQAYSLWQEEWEKDESGQLEARFITLMNKYHVALQIGDTKDMSQETRAGISLRDYAKVAVAVTQQPNADVESILKANGIAGLDQWQSINQAWVEAMSKDVNVATQYGLLYQEFAGAGFAAEQEARLANQLGGRYDDEVEDVEEDEQSESGPGFYAKELSSPVNEDRWYAADRMLFHCSRFNDFGDDEGLGLAELCSEQAMSNKIVPVVQELLTNFDNGDVEQASGILRLVKEMDLQTAVGKKSVNAALQRAQSQYAEIREKYELVQFKNVPEKSLLRSRMDLTQSAIEEIQDELEDWE